MATLPSTTGLRVVAALAQHGTVSAAAEAVGLTQSAVSKQLKTLEGLAGLPLFDRTPHGLMPTPAGTIYIEQSRIALGALEVAALRTAGLRAARWSRPMLRLHVLPILGDRWFMQRLALYAEQRPDLDLRFVTFAPRETFREVDVAFRFGEGRWPGWDADYFLGREVVVVGAPGYLAARGGIAGAGDLGRCRLLVHKRTPLSWEEVFRAHGGDGSGAEIATLGYYALVIRAAIAGQGLALVPRSLVVPELAAGTLVNPGGLGFESRNCYWLTMPSDRAPGPEARAFRAWALAEAWKGESTSAGERGSPVPGRSRKIETGS